ncbi:hypothetical protein [Levilactobacillus tujiorum]|uniref:Uncharacterized protein n=1 Tax=Levilactobacillus tujiorum TaxID=2912243 RepID=A0ABX1L288_9LACO|nr:hypothetical protein [Levilactobacillus tujiorum]MCH5464132.1 hypothetical protein [Levilactobacillus tujiorum]NLR11231.1 hypothetical protein [Lactobacillus sp. HBUAS51387]NLR29142.1 hypothetical protein [Levilactobacillus tujiorum]NLR32881.1 hypothetical protein [Levilactobacillus tujiorum]
MTAKQCWASISILLYVAFVLVAIFTGIIAPKQVGLEWTIFWYFTAAGLCYYFYFKNVSYREVIYYAKKLGYHKDDLVSMVSKLKETQDVPDPDHPRLLSPLAKVPLTVVNQLTDQLEAQAKEQHIPRYR